MEIQEKYELLKQKIFVTLIRPDKRGKIVDRLKGLGFQYMTLDLQGAKWKYE